MTLCQIWRCLSLIVISGACVVLTGCKGLATQGEKEARGKAQSVAGNFRPNGIRPALPDLSSASGLSNYLAFALLNQPSVEAAYYDWLASVERITQARSFPDPQFTLQIDIQNVVTSVMPGLMGTIPWPSKLRSAALVATQESESKYVAFQAAVLKSAFEVKRAYYQLFFLAEKIRVSQETLSLLSGLEQLARAQNEVGKVTLQDVLRAQIEQDRLKSDIANLEDSRPSLEAQFKAALGLRTSDAMPPMPSHFESSLLAINPDQLLSRALEQNTRLKAMAADVRAAEASLIVARRGSWPDFSLGFMADARTTPTLYRLPGGPGTVSLPIWRDKIAAQIAEAQANKHAVEARLSSEEISLAVDVAAKSFLFREATRNLALLNEQLLPKARQSLEVARSGYLGGQVDFLNLTDSERTLLGFEMDKVESAMQREIILAELSLIAQGLSPTSVAMGDIGTAAGPSGRGGPKGRSPAM
jgi:outer membrane protein TolC